MELSIIIVSWNCLEELKLCLESLRTALSGRDVETIVVDNASSDGTPGMVRDLFQEVRLVVNQDNRGFAAANNQGLCLSGGEYIMLLNPDTVLSGAAVEGLLGFMRSVPEAGAAGPAFSAARGLPHRIRPGIYRFPGAKDELFLDTFLGDIASLLAGLVRYRGRAPAVEPSSGPVETHWVSGACMLVRRKAVEEAGSLDERFFLYMEELEWCYRLRRSGWKIFVLPGLGVIHTGGASSSKISATRISALFYESRYKYFAKYWPSWRVLLLRAAKAGLLAVTLLLMLPVCLLPGALGSVARNRAAGISSSLPVVLGLRSARR